MAELADAMRRIGDEAARMRRLVDGLLDLARLDDLGVLAREPVDLAVVVRDVASDLRVVAPDRVVTVDAPESLVVTADRDRLTQALVGLASNAVRHTPAGTPVRLSLVALPVRCGSRSPTPDPASRPSTWPTSSSGSTASTRGGRRRAAAAAWDSPSSTPSPAPTAAPAASPPSRGVAPPSPSPSALTRATSADPTHCDPPTQGPP